jgi:hypothetical protein
VTPCRADDAGAGYRLCQWPSYVCTPLTTREKSPRTMLGRWYGSSAHIKLLNEQTQGGPPCHAFHPGAGGAPRE